MKAPQATAGDNPQARSNDCADFRRAFEAFPHGAAIAKSDGTTLYSNPVWNRVAGPNGIFSSLRPADALALRRLLAESAPAQLDIHVGNPAAGYRIFRAEISPLDRADGTGACLVTLTNIDMHKRSERRFNSIVRSNMIGIAVTDFRDRIVEANDAFLAIVGYSQTDLAEGRLSWRTISPQEYYELDEIKVRQLFEEGSMAPFEKEYIAKDGTRVPVIVGAALLDREEGSGICFMLDIRERKALELRKDEFISIASHELKTPLTSQKINVQLLRRMAARNEHAEYLPTLQKVETQIDKLTTLVSDLLDISRIQEGRFILAEEDVDIMSCVREAIDEFGGSGDHAIELRGETARRVRGDSQRLAQVFTNLLSNAIKYSPRGSTIAVTLEEEPGEVAIAVADRGIGIAEKYMPHLFERFFRVGGQDEKTYPGMGIGLHIVSEIVKRHGGRVIAESVYGQGSTFTVRLPLAS